MTLEINSIFAEGVQLFEESLDMSKIFAEPLKSKINLTWTVIKPILQPLLTSAGNHREHAHDFRLQSGFSEYHQHLICCLLLHKFQNPNVAWKAAGVSLNALPTWLFEKTLTKVSCKNMDKIKISCIKRKVY